MHFYEIAAFLKEGQGSCELTFEIKEVEEVEMEAVCCVFRPQQWESVRPVCVVYVLDTSVAGGSNVTARLQSPEPVSITKTRGGIHRANGTLSLS